MDSDENEIGNFPKEDLVIIALFVAVVVSSAVFVYVDDTGECADHPMRTLVGCLLSDYTQPRANLDAEVNETEGYIKIAVSEMGKSDYVLIRGDSLVAEVLVNGTYRQAAIVLNESGQSVTLRHEKPRRLVKENGTIYGVSVKGELKNTYSPVWSEGHEVSNASLAGIEDSKVGEGEAAFATIQQVDYNFSGGN